MSHTTSHTLQRRVRRLRALAEDLERSPMLRLDSGVCDDMWSGSRRQLCPNLLQANQAQVHSDADRLRWQAYLFELGASQLAAIEAHRAAR